MMVADHLLEAVRQFAPARPDFTESYMIHSHRQSLSFGEWNTLSRSHSDSGIEPSLEQRYRSNLPISCKNPAAKAWCGETLSTCVAIRAATAAQPMACSQSSRKVIGASSGSRPSVFPGTDCKGKVVNPRARDFIASKPITVMAWDTVISLCGWPAARIG